MDAKRKQASRLGAVEQAVRPSAAKKKTPKRSGESNHSSDNAGCESVGVAWLSKHFRVSEDSDNQATTRNASPPRWHQSRCKFQMSYWWSDEVSRCYRSIEPLLSSRHILFVGGRVASLDCLAELRRNFHAVLRSFASNSKNRRSLLLKR